ncbi:unnamed protein product [Arabidopsis arenosa]|uniref:NYN domain-containing protein n=1 Tax=Arabidopsis arenosa TaxID=38785 RepID=A0A8S1ZGE8_ARAAE|nr:unnamed protein product [Arabidopsis arenosa]
MMKKPTMEEAAALTSVFWDIKRCPVPTGCDARLVSPCIKRALKNKGYSGPLTITVVGILSEVPDDVLRVVSSTGIVLNHVATDCLHVADAICEWAERYPPPANLMVISDNKYHPSLLRIFSKDGYNILEPFPFSELEGALEEDKCSVTGESASWVCSICEYLPGQGFEKFTNHLSSQNHAQKLLTLLPVNQQEHPDFTKYKQDLQHQVIGDSP